jgi:DNA adenine methylase
MKWTGSKRLSATYINAEVPDHSRYIEPFVGGGSMLYLFAGPGSIASDSYAPLIKLWQMVQSDIDDVVDNYRIQWHLLQENLPQYYYFVRDRFNSSEDPLDLLFLTRTCVNGIIRFNKDGKFNNSFHLSRPGMNPDRFEKIARVWSDRIKSVDFTCSDYRETVDPALSGDFVYMDPPYAGNRDRYQSDLDTGKFFETLEQLNNRDVKWAVSFDGHRGDHVYDLEVPSSLYRRRLMIPVGHSAVKRALSGKLELVEESLYLNY